MSITGINWKDHQLNCSTLEKKENHIETNLKSSNTKQNLKSICVPKSHLHTSNYSFKISSISCNSLKYKPNFSLKETTSTLKIPELITKAPDVGADNVENRTNQSKVGSLNSSPKWSRIKDKFEKGEHLQTNNKLNPAKNPSNSLDFRIKTDFLFPRSENMYLKALSSDISVNKPKSSTLPAGESIRGGEDKIKYTKNKFLDNKRPFLTSKLQSSSNITMHTSSSKLQKQTDVLSKDTVKQNVRSQLRPMGYMKKENENCKAQKFSVKIDNTKVSKYNSVQDIKCDKKITVSHPIPTTRTSLNKIKTHQIYGNTSVVSLTKGKSLATGSKLYRDRNNLSGNEVTNKCEKKAKVLQISTKTNLQKNVNLDCNSKDDDEQSDNETKESKVAYLTNKFNSLSCQKFEMKKSSSVVNVDKTNQYVLSKSLSSSNVFAATWQKSKIDVEMPNSNDEIYSECLPVDSVPCAVIEKCSCLGLFSKPVNQCLKKEETVSICKNEKICTQPIGNKDLHIHALNSTDSELSAVQKAILSYEENLALSSPEMQRKHFECNSKNSSLFANSLNSNKIIDKKVNSKKSECNSVFQNNLKTDRKKEEKAGISTPVNEKKRIQRSESDSSTSAFTSSNESIHNNEKVKSSFLHSTVFNKQHSTITDANKTKIWCKENRYENKLESQKMQDLIPNASFLWTHSSSQQRRKLSAPSKIGVYENMMGKITVDDHSSQEDINEFLITDIDRRPLEQTVKCENEYNNIGSCDSDEQESWVDISDAELENNVSMQNSGTLRRTKAKKDAYRKNQVRRSWCDSLRATKTKNKGNEDDEYQDVSVWETADGENSSESTDDLQAEPIYESIYQSPFFDDDDSSSQSPDYNKPDSETVGEVFDNDDSISIQTTSSRNSELSIPPNNDKKVLRRNWSLTRSDIRLELTSKLNKIITKRNVHSSIELGTKERQPETSTKKNTLMKYFLGQRSNTAGPVLGSSFGKKDSSTFYISTDDDKSEYSFNNQDPSQHKDGQIKIDDRNQQCNFKKSQSMKPLLRRDIQRPTAPPPLPPGSSIVKCRTGTKSMELIRSHAITFNKTRSLDCAYYNKYKDTDVLYTEITIHENNLSNKNSISEISSISTSEGEIIPSSSSSERTISENSSPPCSKGSRHSDNCYSVSSSITDSSTDKEMCSLVSENSSKDENPPTSVYQMENDNETGYDKNKLYVNETVILKSPFEEEPLYQFYLKDVRTRAILWQRMISDEEQSETQNTYVNVNDKSSKDEQPILKSQLSAMELIKRDGAGQRTLWCEVPEVQKSGILSTLSTQERNLQEAMFEVITSEASYLKSLNILIEHFIQCLEFSDGFSPQCVLDQPERHILFSDVFPVKEVSEKLLADLENHWKENIMLTDVCDILYNYALHDFSVYVRYCSNQIYQERKLKTLKETKSDFLEVLHRLESSPVCQCLDMHSFLMLPMQRITRLPLLVDAIFHRLTVDSPIYEKCKMTLSVLNKVVQECNEQTRKMERMEEMLAIDRQLNFKDCKAIPLISASRWLVKKGELTRYICDTSSKRTISFSARWSKVPVYLFLFTDYLLVTKKKSEESFVVLDYCPRNMVQVVVLTEAEHSHLRLPSSGKNFFKMTMLNNNKGKTVDVILGVSLESERTRWMEAVTPPTSDNPDERIYEVWDCPQVQCIYPYTAQQPDELTIEECDVVNVFRKMSDGWYEGERIRDGVRGWFPASYSVEIVSSHVRARNLRQRYRLLMSTQAHLSDQQKVK